MGSPTDQPRKRSVEKQGSGRLRAPLALVAAVMLLLGIPATGASAGSSGPVLLYAASAYGTKAVTTDSQGHRVSSGKSAPVVFGCVTLPGAHDENTVATVTVPKLVKTGHIDTTVDALGTTSAQIAQATSEVHHLDILGGVITADQMKSVSITKQSSGGFAFATTGSKFVNLTIGGHAIESPPKTRKVAIPGLGRVVIFQIHRTSTADSAEQIVNMLHVVVTQKNPQGIPVGTSIIVGHARSALFHAVGPLGGRAYGVSENVGQTVVSGPWFTQHLACAGTDGKTETNAGVFVGLPPAADGGPIANTAVGTVTPAKATGETTSTMKQVNLLDGMITADLVKADVHATNDNGTRTFGDEGSHYVNLVINGHGGTDNVKPGTKVALPGIGTVFLFEVARTPHSIQVTMIEVKVLQKNQLHLPVGTDIKVSVARVSAH